MQAIIITSRVSFYRKFNNLSDDTQHAPIITEIREKLLIKLRFPNHFLSSLHQISIGILLVTREFILWDISLILEINDRYLLHVVGNIQKFVSVRRMMRRSSIPVLMHREFTPNYANVKWTEDLLYYFSPEKAYSPRYFPSIFRTKDTQKSNSPPP